MNDMTKLKGAKTRAMRNLATVMPMVEEITKKKLVPLCLIGFSVSVKDGTVNSLFSTLNDEHDKVVYECCKKLVEQLKHKYE